MNELDLAQPKRQSGVGVAVIFFKNLRVAVNIFISVIIVQFGLKFTYLGIGLKEIGFIIAGIFLIISYLQYRRFFFYVVGDKFVIEKGLISRDKITIPFDRIQTVNINQNVIQQLLGVVALKIDTAGSADKELEISALEKSYARELQKYLIEKKVEATSTSSLTETNEAATAPAEDGSSATLANVTSPAASTQMDLSDERPLIHLGIKDLLLVGLTENHIRTGLVLFVVVNGYISQFQEYLLDPFQPWIEEQADFIVASWLILLPIGILAFLVISVLLSMIQAALRYFNLYFFVDSKGVQLVSGLLRRSEFQIPVQKIQYLKWKSNPLRMLLGIETLVVKQASSEDIGDRKSVRVPGCRKEHLAAVLDEFFPERKNSNFYLYRSHPLLFTQLSIWLGVVPAIALSIPGFLGWRFAFFGVTYLILALFFIYKYYRSVGLAVNEDMLIVKKGWVYPGHQAFKFYKLQDITLRQSIFQKQRNLVSIQFHTAAGDITMPHISIEEARQLYDYALYKIEVDQRGWM